MNEQIILDESGRYFDYIFECFIKNEDEQKEKDGLLERARKPLLNFVLSILAALGQPYFLQRAHKQSKQVHDNQLMGDYAHYDATAATTPPIQDANSPGKQHDNFDWFNTKTNDQTMSRIESGLIGEQTQNMSRFGSKQVLPANQRLQLNYSLNQHRCYLKFYNPFKIFGDEPHYKRCPIQVYVLHLVVVCLVVRLTIQIYSLIDFLNNIEMIKKYSLRRGAWQSPESCIKQEDIIKPLYYFGPDVDNTIFEQNVDYLYEQFRYIGSPTILKGNCLAFLSINVIIILACLYMTPIMHRNKPLYLASLSFFLNPLEERRRLRYKLYHVVHNLYKTGDYTHHNRKHRPTENAIIFPKVPNNETHKEANEIRHPVGLRRDSLMLHTNLSPNPITLVDLNEKRYTNQLESLETQSIIQFKCSCIEESEQRMQLTESIIKDQLIDRVWPNELDTKLHDKQAAKQAEVIRKYIILVTILGALPYLCIVANEILIRAELRLKIIICKRTYNNATILFDPYRMWSDRVTEMLIQTNERFNKDFIEPDLKYSDLIFELFELTNFYVYRDLLVQWACQTIAICWIFGFLFVYVDGRLFKLNWVHQLQNQLDNCILILDELHKLSKRCDFDRTELSEAIERSSIVVDLQSPQQQQQQQSIKSDLPIEDKFSSAARLNVTQKRLKYLESKQKVAMRRRQTEQALIITYLNFELFRNEYPDYRQVINFILFHIFILFTLNSFLTYYVFSSAFERMTTLDISLYGCVNSFAIILLNYLVITSSQLVSKIVCLYRTIDLMMPRVSLNKMELSYIAKLWRRQMMAENDVYSAFCIQILQNQFHSSRLVSINSYVLVLWLVLVRSLQTASIQKQNSSSNTL